MLSPFYSEVIRMTTLAAWLLGIMLLLQPHAPWKSTFATTADAIAEQAEADPLFAGADGPARSALLALSTGDFESALKPDAVGDCGHDGPCKAGEVGRSVCFGQVGVSNLRTLGTTREAMQSDIRVCVRAMWTMLKGSLAVCRARPLEERLAHYTAGGDGCSTNEDAVRKSKHRVLKALYLFRHHPPPAPSS
jgi:hypothetical protein